MKHKKIIRSGLGQGIGQTLGMLLLAGSTLALTACGGGANNAQNPNYGSSGSTTRYSGPPAATTDVTNFQQQLWNNIHDTMHCGSCHDAGGQGGLDFANNSDINAAYSAAYTVVNLKDPASSKMVSKFSSGGHFCWLGSDTASQNACASALTTWIQNWANASAGATSSTTINLVAPAIHQPAAAVVLPTTMPPNYASGNAGLNIYTLVKNNCSGCHVPNPTKNPTAVSPMFAVDTNGGADSYAVVSSVPLIDASNPENSRLYTRLKIDGHNCFGTSCDDAANKMLSAINWLLQDPAITSSNSGADLLSKQITSDAVNLLSDGIVASGGGRFEVNQIAMYNFMLGSGNRILDRSGISPAMDLTLNGVEGTDYQWLSNWGIQFNTKDAKAQASTTSSQKLTTMIGATGQYSIEAWVVPANVTQADANIVSYSGGPTARNFALAQNADEYESLNRTTTSASANGDALDTTGSKLLATLQHVVVTYDPTNGRRYYINGVLDTTDTETPSGALTNWDSSFAFVLGNEVSLTKPWKGAIRMLAIHDRALTPTQVKQNYDAGVGQNYYMLFNISQNLPGMGCTGSNGEQYCFIVMKAAVLDQSSYVFSNPRFVDLNDASANFTNSLLIKGMRIGVNGVEAPNGQAYQDIDICVNSGCGDANETDVAYNHTGGADAGAVLSSVGTIIPMQNGPKGNGNLPPDMIFLTFEALGQKVTQVTYDAPNDYTSTPPAVNPNPYGDQIMIHSYEEINAALSAMTGVSRTNPAINFDTTIDGNSSSDGTYTTVIQALPSSHDASSYVPANQMAVTQLAISYCDQLVKGNGTISPSSYFPSFGFSGTTPPNPVDFTNPTTRSEIIEPLLERVMNVDYSTGTPTELTTMPAESTVHGYLDSLIYDNSVSPATGLATSCANGPAACQPGETANIIKATCAAATAGAPMLLK